MAVSKYEVCRLKTCVGISAEIRGPDRTLLCHNSSLRTGGNRRRGECTFNEPIGPGVVSADPQTLAVSNFTKNPLQESLIEKSCS